MRKLSDIKGQESMQVLADLVGPIANLAQDEKVMEMFAVKPVPKGKDKQAVAMERLAKGLPPLMKDHGDDFIKILAIIDGKTEEEYEADMTLQSLLQDFYSVMSDPSFRSKLL